MTKKEAIESIKNATKAIAALFYEEDQKFEAVKVKDGSQDVSIEGEFAKGSKVMVSSSTGSVPAPDGNYELANGQSFSTKEGVIDEIMSGESDDDSKEDFSNESEVKPEEVIEEVKAEEPKPEEEIKPEENSEIKELVEKVQGLEEAFKALKDAFATKEDMKALGENFTAIKSAFDVLSDTPAEFSKVDHSVLAKEDKAKKLEALAGLMKK